jgi:drug/metabolite transporter (DMT)-like permease
MSVSLPSQPALGPSLERAPSGGALPVVAYLALCFIWGSTYLAIRTAVETLPPHIMVGGRSVLAGAVMGGVALAIGSPWPTRRQLASAAVAGLLLFAGGQAFLATAEMHVPSGQAAVVNATQAIFMPLAAWALGAGRIPGAAAWFGLLVGLAGVAVLVGAGSGAVTPWGAGLMLLSVLSWSLGGAVARRHPAGPLALSAGLQMLIGGAACLLIAWPAGEWHGFALHDVSHRSWIGLLYLATIGSFAGFGAFTYLVQVWPMDRLATYTYVNPVVALLLGTAVAGERFSRRDLLATALILGAVAVVMWGGRSRLRDTK